MKNQRAYFVYKKHLLLGLLSVAFIPTVLNAGNTNAKPKPSQEATKLPMSLDGLLDRHLRSVGTLVGDSGPTCFIAHCNDGENPYILNQQKCIAENLKLMGIRAIYDENGDLGPGKDIFEFMRDGVIKSDFVLFILTPVGKQKVLAKGQFYPQELKYVERRIIKTNNTDFLIPVLMAGNHETAVPKQLEDYKYLDSRIPETEKFDSAIFWRQIWPEFEKRIFRDHPKFAAIKAVLDKGSVELGFGSQSRISRNFAQQMGSESELDEPNQKKTFPATRHWRKVCSEVIPFYLLPENDSFVESFPPGAKISYLTRVWESLAGDFAKYTVAGMGGIGKSQLALAFAYEAYRHNAYEVIYWIRSKTEEDLVQDYKRLLEALGFPIPLDNKSIINSIIQNLPKKRWLLIFDNVPSEAFIKDKIPKKNGHILITSCDQHGWLPEKTLNIGVFQEEEAVKHLFHVTGIERTEENVLQAKKLSGTLGYLPLALSHAAAYIKAEELDQSFGRYNQKAAERLFYIPEGSDYPYAVAMTWAITRKKLYPLAKQLLTYFSYLEPDRIDPEWFFSVNNPERNEEIGRAVKQLQRYSMIKYDAQEKLSIHPLVQLVERINQQHKGASERTLKVLQEQWTELWEEKNRQYGTGLFSKSLALPIDEIARANSSTHKIYRHLKSIKKYIDEIRVQQTTGVIRGRILLECHKQLESLVETVMDITFPIALSRYQPESKIKSYRDNYSFKRSLAENLSVSDRYCEFLLEIAAPFLPKNANGQECFEILLGLEGHYGGDLDSTLEVNLRETICAARTLQHRLIRPNDAKHLLSALRSISSGKKESAAAKSALIITRPMNGRNIEKIIDAVARVQDLPDWPQFLEKAKNIKQDARTEDDLGSQIRPFSRVFPGSWEVFCDQVSLLNVYTENQEQYYDIMQTFSKVSVSKRDVVLSCTKKLSGSTSKAEDVKKIIRTLASLKDDIERITEVVLRHPEITSTDTKCRLMEALQGWGALGSEGSDDVIEHALVFSGTYVSWRYLEVIASIKPDEREEVVNYTKTLYSDWDKLQALKLIASIEQPHRTSIVNVLKRILSKDEKFENVNQFNEFIEILKHTPIENRNDFILLKYPYIKSINIKYRLFKALQEFDGIDTDSVIPYAAPFLGTDDKKNIELLKVIALVKPDEPDEREEIMTSTKTLFDIWKYPDVLEYINILVSIKKSDRPSIVDRLKLVMPQNKKILDGDFLNSFVEALKQTPEERRGDLNPNFSKVKTR